MNKHILLISAIILGISHSECNKSAGITGSASLNIINALDSSTALVTNFQTFNAKGSFVQPLQYYATANQIPYGNSWESGSYVGSVSLSLADFSDTSNILWSGNLDLPNGSIHSLFLSGDTSSVDTLLITDVIPYYPFTDSVAGVRFINLSKGSLPISVNIQGNPPTQYEFGNLGYRLISSFKQYPAGSNANLTLNGITFEIRDQASEALLTTISWNYTLFKNT